MKTAEMHRGSCHCGGVRFVAEGALRPVVACHCTQCRKTSGHYWVATSVPLDRFRLTRDETLSWYQSSAAARRGFCHRCGASLFWLPEGEGRMSFSPAALDEPSGLTISAHWFPEDAGDYYAPEGPPPAQSAASGLLLCACLCGDVAFQVPGPAGDITACHCTQCRKLSGHYSASFDADAGRLVWLRRGAVTGATGGRLCEHIFAAKKGDYYSLNDGLPVTEGG